MKTFNLFIIAALFLNIIACDKDSNENVIDNTENGSILVFHDSVKASKNLQYSLPKVLAHFKNEGYEFKAL